jgi:hypothetical protein
MGGGRGRGGILWRSSEILGFGLVRYDRFSVKKEISSDVIGMLYLFDEVSI